MNKLEQAARQALKALENERSHMTANWDNIVKAITALQEALEPNREGKYYYKDNACTASSADSPDCICWHDEALAEQAEQEPDAICDHLKQQAEQGPVAWFVQYKNRHEFVFGSKPEFIVDGVVEPLYAAPVRTKDLTDQDIREIIWFCDEQTDIPFARAVIAADREKNK